jgi:hypothetical protein
VARKNRIARKILPCIDEDFSSSLARSGDVREPNYPPRIVTTDYRKNRSYKPGKPDVDWDRDSFEKNYEAANCCEKGDMLTTVTSIGSLGSAPTLVDGKEIDWRYSFPGSPASISSPRRISTISSPPMSPITPLAPCLLRNVEDDDEIYPYP